MSVIYEIVLSGKFSDAFFPNLSSTFILENLNYYLNIEESCFKKIEKKILTNIQNKKLILLLKLINEGDITESDMQILEALLEKYNIKTDSCVLVHDLYKLPNTNIKNYQLNNHLFLKSKESVILNKENKLNTSVLTRKRYKFHIPIRRFRYHRLLLLNKLFEKYPNFIDSNLVSYDINTELNKSVLNHSNVNESLKQYMLLNAAKIIDVGNLEDIKGYGFEFKQVYSESYFTIVTETYFFEPYYYVSEKTFKPIAHMHPFIIFGRPGTLEYLKNCGFKTFHPFIDESYDLEEDNNKRFNMVYNEIVRLNELSNEELDNIMDKITNILQHNQRLLLQIETKNTIYSKLLPYIRNYLNTKNLI